MSLDGIGQPGASWCGVCQRYHVLSTAVCQRDQVKEYCEICKRYHEPGLCPAERIMPLLTGASYFVAQLADRDWRINEAALWLTDTTRGTPQERANKAVELLKGIQSREDALK